MLNFKRHIPSLLFVLICVPTGAHGNYLLYLISDELGNRAGSLTEIFVTKDYIDLDSSEVSLDQNNPPYWERIVSVPEAAALATWSAVGQGLFGPPFKLKFDGSGNLFAGGLFNVAGVPSANHIAKWDGQAWSALGDGLKLTVLDFAFDQNGDLYASGLFSQTGGTNEIAKFDGSQWSWTGLLLPRAAETLVFDQDGVLFAGGSFANSRFSRIAKKTGNGVWSALESEITDGEVRSLVFDNIGNLFAGGSFTTAGGNTIYGVAKWDGKEWTSLGSGLTNGIVNDLTFDDFGNLYAGGSFDTAGGDVVNGIAKWDGNEWTSLGSGMVGGTIFDIVFDGAGNVYAAGSFTTAGGNVANNVAKWDGNMWIGLNGGVNDESYCLAYDGSNGLYVGGYFDQAGPALIPAEGIAIWDGASPSLPVELSSFSAIADARSVVLDWQTQSEMNNAGFGIEHRQISKSSISAENWQEIEFLQGKGSTLEVQNYSYELSELLPGRHGFRLRQVDFDGSSEYSTVVEVSVDVPGKIFLSKAYPNPFGEVTNFSLAVSVEQHVRVDVFDLTGRIVATVFEGVLAGGLSHQMQFEAGRLKSGFYIVRAHGETFIAIQKVVLSD